MATHDNPIVVPNAILKLVGNSACQGFGFIDMGGITLFVHQSECEPGKVPKVGDVLTFQYEPRRQNPEQFQAGFETVCWSAEAQDISRCSDPFNPFHAFALLQRSQP